MPFTPTYEVPEDRLPYTFKSGSAGCLMLHGFMGSPKSSRGMAQFLAARGITVHCPLLPGHGQLLDKMHKISCRDWMAEAREGVDYLRSLCDEIFIIGHSMGTVLGAQLVQDQADIRGLVLLAPLYDVPHRAIRLLALLRHVMPWFYPMKFKRLHSLVHQRLLDLYPELDLNLRDPEIVKWMTTTSRVPTSAVDEMRKMGDMGRKIWPQLQIPALILHGREDHVASPGNAQVIHEMLPGPDKALHFFDDAGHELMRDFDPAHEAVWAMIYDFLRARTSPDGDQGETKPILADSRY